MYSEKASFNNGIVVLYRYVQSDALSINGGQVCVGLRADCHHNAPWRLDLCLCCVRRCIGHNPTMGAIAGRRVLNIPDLCCPVRGVGVSFNVLPWRRFWPCCIGRCFFVVLSLNLVHQGDGPTGHLGTWCDPLCHRQCFRPLLVPLPCARTVDDGCSLGGDAWAFLLTMYDVIIGIDEWMLRACSGDLKTTM